MKTITMKDLEDPEKVGLFEWVEHNALHKGVPLDSLPIDNEVKKWFKGYLRDKEEETNERLRGW